MTNVTFLYGVIGVLIIAVISILVYFLVYHKPDTSTTTTTPVTSTTTTTTPVTSTNILGFPIKPGNEFLDFVNEIEDDLKPLLHGMLCSIVSGIKKQFLDEGLPTEIKCSDFVEYIENMKNEIENEKKEMENDPFFQFSEKHKIYDTIQSRLENLYTKLYKRFCKGDEDVINRDTIEKIINEFETHLCEGVDKIDISSLGLIKKTPSPQ
jgi:hypothetical protein